MSWLRLFKTVFWDLRLQVKYQIITVAVVITILYVAIFKLLAGSDFDELLILLIFTDPVMIGFIFIGALVLFEKTSSTLDALVVTPLRIVEYLFSKIISLGIISVVSALLMMIAGHGFRFNYLMFIYGVFMTSSIVTLLGFAGAARVRNFNQYFIIIPQFLAPLALPLLNFFNLTNSWVLYLLPTQATLHLLWGSCHPISGVDLTYSILSLPAWLIITAIFAARSFRRHILLSGKT